ncbi:hypothetical protein ACJBU6_02144 [Exserohilum turcicum]
MASGIKPAWQAVARKKQQQRDEVMQRFADAETAGSEAVGSRGPFAAGAALPSSIDAVATAISTGAVTASQLLRAYMDRAIAAHKQTNWHVSPCTPHPRPGAPAD